jgi:hypothetical protein
MENVGLCSVRWYILWPFGIMYGCFGVVCGPLVIFFQFLYVWTKKNLATLI